MWTCLQKLMDFLTSASAISWGVVTITQFCQAEGQIGCHTALPYTSFTAHNQQFVPNVAELLLQTDIFYFLIAMSAPSHELIEI